jgi:hypothetical protein
MDLQEYRSKLQTNLLRLSLTGEDVVEPAVVTRILDVLSQSFRADFLLPGVAADGEGGAALFWSVDRHTLEVEFHADGSYYMRMKPHDGLGSRIAEGGSGEPFPASTLTQHLEALAEILVLHRG